MSSPTPNVVMAGFSTANRCLLYASLMLTPAQVLSGVGSNSPINLGFLAYNVYQQYLWYIAAKAKNLHALSILPIYLNFIYAITYLGGIPSERIFLGVLAAIGTSVLVTMNTITACVSLTTNLPEGDGIYQFYFFGWKRLTKGWRIFFLLWEIIDVALALSMFIFAFVAGVVVPLKVKKEDVEGNSKFILWRDTAVLWGSVAMLVPFGFPFILFVELVVKRNNIVSETDMVSVYLFIAQAVLMVLPIFTDRVVMVLWEWKFHRLLSRKAASNTTDSQA